MGIEFLLSGISNLNSVLKEAEKAPTEDTQQEKSAPTSINNIDAKRTMSKQSKQIKRGTGAQMTDFIKEEPKHELSPINARLCIINQRDIDESERQKIDQEIDQLIASHKNSRQEINRLVFESVAALTAGEDYERQFANKKGLRRFIGGITGSNKKLQDKINSSRAAAQYASQQTLQRLAEQNLMTFDLIAAVNNKLNVSMLSVEGEINQIYSALVTFFKQSRSDMIQLENRVERLEKNVNLLNWQNAIEYQMFNGVEYAELEDSAKIVCLVRDFYNITKGEWMTSDLLLLKTAMSTIDLSPKKSIGYFDFIKAVAYDNRLSQYLLDGKQIAQQPESYLAPLLGVRKLALLDGEERFVVDTIVESLSESGVAADRRSLSERTVKKYLVQEAQVNPDAQVNCYDLIMEMLFNLREAEDAGILLLPEESNALNAATSLEHDYQNAETLFSPEKSETLDTATSLDCDYQKAAELFKNCQLREAHPLLVRLSDQGYAQANALLYWLCLDGYVDFPPDKELAKAYATKGYQAGDTICAVQYALFCTRSQDEKQSLYAEFKPKLKELADSGDVFALYMIGICYVNNTDERRNYNKTINYFLESVSQNFYRAFRGMALRYQDGKGVSKSMENALVWAVQATKFSQYMGAIDAVADILYDMERHGEESELFQQIIEGKGSVSIILHEIGSMYENGRSVTKDIGKAITYYTKAVELGDDLGLHSFSLAMCYYQGDGVSSDKNMAKYWFEKSAAQGSQEAIVMLNLLSS